MQTIKLLPLSIFLLKVFLDLALNWILFKLMQFVLCNTRRKIICMVLNLKLVFKKIFFFSEHWTKMNTITLQPHIFCWLNESCEYKGFKIHINFEEKIRKVQTMMKTNCPLRPQQPRHQKFCLLWPRLHCLRYKWRHQCRLQRMNFFAI